MALSIVAPESTLDKDFHPEPRHGEDHHHNVFKKRAAPASVIIVGDKAQSFHSVAPPCHHEVFTTSPASPDLQIRIEATPLSVTESAPSHLSLHLLPPTRSRGKATATALVPTAEPTMRTAIRSCRPGIHVRDATNRPHHDAPTTVGAEKGVSFHS